MKNILLPTDFSTNAWNALFMASKLFAQKKCVFYVMHVFEPKAQNLMGIKSSVRAGDAYEALSSNSQKELDKIITYAKDNLSNENHQYKILSLQGDLSVNIKAMIAKYDIDMIVMGTKGATGARGVFMGSNTVRVIKTIKNTPLLAVPEDFDFKALKSLVFPTEFAHFFPKGVLAPLLELVRLWQTEIKIFHVAQEFILNDLQKANRDILKARFKEFNFAFYKVDIKTTVANAIQEFAEEQKADMIVLTNYSHTFFEKLTQEPVVKKVGFKTNIPLLVLPDFEG